MSKRQAAMITNGRSPGHTVKESATAPLVTPPHGPNALLNTPGLGKRRKGRKWGQRTKALPAPTRQLTAGHTGVMVALMLPPDVACQIAALDGVTEPAEQLHLTLCFLGDSTETPLKSNDARVLAAVRDWALREGKPLRGTLNGVGRFYNTESDGTNAVYLAPDLPDLPALRQSLVEAIERAGFDYARNHGFTPHITVAYVPQDAPTPAIRVEAPLRFDRVTLAWGDAHYDLPLGPPPVRKSTGYTYRYKAAGPPGEKIAPGVTRIRGNLCNVHGRFGPCDSAGSSDRRPKAPGFRPKKTTGRAKKPAKPKQTPEQRQAARDAEQAKNRETVGAALNASETENGLSASGLNAMQSLRTGGEVSPAMATGLVQMGLAETGRDGRVRLTGTGRAALSAADRGDVTAVQDAVSRANDAASGRRERETKREQRRAEVEARRAKREADKKRGGGGGTSKPTAQTAAPADRATQQRETAQATAAQLPEAERLSAAGVGALEAAVNGTLGGARTPVLTRLGLVDAQGNATDQGRRALSALQRGNVGQYRAAVQDAQARMSREADRAARAEERTTRQAQREAVRQGRLNRLRDRARSGAKLTEAQRDQLTDAGLAEESGGTWRVKGGGLAVFKDARTGRLRWISRTTTAFRDRDGEILSVEALERAAARMKATGRYGPLRWWHLGEPTPWDAERPWGTGLDLGMCDTAIVIGRTLVESGTFYDDELGAALATKAADLEMSPGFVYQPEWRQDDGTFSDIAIFERSPVPTRYGRASNLFTGFTTTKEFTPMDEREIARRLAALKHETGADDATIARLNEQRRTAEKAADGQRVAFKSSEGAPSVYELNGQLYVVEAGKLVALKAAMPPEEMIEAGTTEVEDGELEEAAEDLEEPVTDFIGDMSRADFEAMLEAAFARAVQGMGADISAKMAAMDEQLKGMGYARAKEATDVAAVTAKVATLETQLKEARTQLAQLTDDATRRGRGVRPSIDAPDADAATAAKLKAQQHPAAVVTGDRAVDAVAAWLAPDGQLPPIPGLNGVGVPFGTLFGTPATGEE
jgi:2'-5' RNA ligase